MPSTLMRNDIGQNTRQKRSKRALSLVEILLVLFVIAIVTTIVGIPVIQNAFSPSGGKRIALLFSEFARHSQGWALENGTTVVIRLNLTTNEMAFFSLDPQEELLPIQDKILYKRQIPEHIRLTAFQGSDQLQEDGLVDIPFLPTGFSRETILYIEDKEQKKTWTIGFKKLYGETIIKDGKVDPDSIQDKIDDNE